MRWVWRAVQMASLSFLAVMVVGIVASLWLPRRNATDWESACYWTDAMLVFVQCGPSAPFGGLRETIYNLYFTMFYALVGSGRITSGDGHGWLYLIGGLAAWAAVIISGMTLWRAAAGRFTSAR